MFDLDRSRAFYERVSRTSAQLVAASVHAEFWRLTVSQARDLVVTEGISPQRLDEWDRQLGELGRWFPGMAMVAACGRRS